VYHRSECAKCCYAECRYAECLGAIFHEGLVDTLLTKSEVERSTTKIYSVSIGLFANHITVFLQLFLSFYVVLLYN